MCLCICICITCTNDKDPYGTIIGGAPNATINLPSPHQYIYMGSWGFACKPWGDGLQGRLRYIPWT